MRGGRLDVTDGANRTFGGFGGAEREALLGEVGVVLPGARRSGALRAAWCRSFS